MKDYKEHKHIGVYGLIIKDNKILLINKVTGPYDGKLDLPGGSFEFGERPEEVLIREIKEETNLDVIEYNLFDSDSVLVDWNSDKGLFKVHHIGIFYKIELFKGELKENLEIDDINNDSMGAKFYNIDSLRKNELSEITIIQLERLGYKIC